MGKFKEKMAAGEPYFIAEMSANHGGSLNRALEIVTAAAASGADCLKVQTYTADTLTLDCDNEWFRIQGGLWDGRTLHDLYSEGSFPWEWHEAVRDRCIEFGMDFLSTPFDETAVDFLCGLGVDALKIASFELTDIPLIEYAASRGKAMILSTGMGTVDEIADAVDACRASGNNDIVLLRCCSEYPATFVDMDLASIPDMVERFSCPVGFSDHSMGHTADVVAAALGARVIEKHFCLTRDDPTPDSAFSMEPAEFKAMVDAVGDAVAAVGTSRYGAVGAQKDSTAFRRSVFASADIATGEPFTKDNVRIVRPGYGLSPKHYRELLGKAAKRGYAFGEPIGEEELL